jgi:predicted GTPase
MMRGAWIRTFWREVLIAALLLLPLLSLLPLGFLWLWQTHGTLIWAGSLLGCVLIAWFLVWLRRHDAPAAPPVRTEDGDLAWGPRELAVWEKINLMARDTPALTFSSQEEALDLCHRTLETVAGALHPDTKYALARFTVPEALLALEQVSRSLRADLLKRVPFIQKIRVSDARWFIDQRRHWPWVERAWAVARVLRLAAGPLAAIQGEARSAIWDHLKNHGLKNIASAATRTLILETGRAAINLYAGRFYLSPEQIQQIINDETARMQPTAPPAPIRILLAGQILAGKSSLLNAMAGETRAVVSVTPTPDGFKLFRITAPDRPEITIIDSPGLKAGGNEIKGLIEEAKKCDLLLWVAAANHPARSLDAETLQRLHTEFASRVDHRPPPILLAVTHIDLLRPAREWTPPYDIAAPATEKAKSIRLALEATAKAIHIPLTDAIPVALPADAAAYNVDLVWARIAVLLPQAQQVQLNRLMTESRGGWSVSEILSQAAAGGKTLLNAVLKSD